MAPSHNKTHAPHAAPHSASHHAQKPDAVAPASAGTGVESSNEVKIPRSVAPEANDSAGLKKPKVAYFNRELSWLAFNRRVLEQAYDQGHPLLERVRFLTIVSSNLDEFFEIRVAGLIQQMENGGGESSVDGLTAKEQLRRIHSVVASLVEDQYRCWHEHIRPALAEAGLVTKTGAELNEAELNWVRSYFREQVLPVLTPLALDQAHPFPQLGNKTLNIVVCLDNPDTAEHERLVAILPVPRILPRFIRLDPEGRHRDQRFIFLTEIIKLCAVDLFPGYHLVGAHAFRVTRNSDLYIEEEDAENLLKTIEDELRNMRRGAAVRLEIEEGVDEAIFSRICAELHLSHEYVYRLRGPLNLLRLQSLTDLDRPDLKFAPFSPVNASPLRISGQIFDTIRNQDILLHHPYDSFSPVIDFIEQAARDPEVFAIKQTLYRTSGDSPVVRALIAASREGKQVTALVELKARFDEANNIQWARQLEEAGVHVVYGILGHKIHCKLCLVVRREGKVLRQYAHLGTGNYNPKTARIYTDLSLFTSQAHLTAEISQVFNTLTGFGRSPEFRHLLVSPYNLHQSIVALIDREASNARQGRPARIIAKMNALVDKATIDHLYEASQAGVQIDLIVRGVCCLVPGIRGLSENIRVRSIVGRFLEHARTFFFQNDGAEPLIFAGSSDWMPRNFFRRVEVLFPIEAPEWRRWIIEDMLSTELRDNADARELYPHGGYLPSHTPAGQPEFRAQEYFMEMAALRAKA